MTTMNAAAMTFGVEIECVVPSAALRSRNIHIAGYHSGGGDSSALPQGWRATQDGSIRTPSFDWVAVEFVSPILSGAAGLESLKAMTELLRAMGAKVNTSCGLHVHIGTPAEAGLVRNLTVNVARFERALWAMSGTVNRERNSHYCKSVKVPAFKNLAMATGKAAQEQALRNVSDRYHVLNLTHVSRSLGSTTKTVEFRVFAGTTNYTKIAAYVMICLGLVSKSAKRTPKASDFDGAQQAARFTRLGKGAGLTSMHELLNWLCWAWCAKAPVRYGALVADLTPFIIELRRLADKYDAQRSGTEVVPNSGDLV